MIFDPHMHVGEFPLFGVSLDREGLEPHDVERLLGANGRELFLGGRPSAAGAERDEEVAATTGD